MEENMQEDGVMAKGTEKRKGAGKFASGGVLRLHEGAANRILPPRCPAQPPDRKE